MPIIKSTYPEGHAFPSLKVIAVCDLHFDAKVIIQLGSKKGLAVDAIPNVRCNFEIYSISNEII